MDKSDNDYRNYLDEHRVLIEAEFAMAKSYDHTLITLSAGALGLSLTFVKDYVILPIAPGLLYSSDPFALSLMAILSSFLVSQSACRRQREINEKKLSNSDFVGTNRYSFVTNCLNWTSLITFILGVITLLAFSITNFTKGN